MSNRTRRRTIVAAGASLALAMTMVGAGLASPTASAWAASAVPALEQLRQESPTPVPKPGRGDPGQGPRGAGVQQRGQMHQAFLNALAGRLGLTADQLTEAMKQARIDVVNQAVAEGRIDQERANRMIQAIQSGQAPFHPGMGPRGGRGPQGPGQGPGVGQRGPGGPGGPQIVADALGMTPQELRTELQAGKSLAQIAEAKGIARDTLKTKLLEAHKARIDAAVAAGRITAEQAQQATARFTANIDRMLDATPGQRGPGHGPGRGF